MKYRAIKGTKDILPDVSHQWQYVESIVHQTMQLFGYHEIRTPIFEQTGLFARSIGELTDIVSKEMYTFTDRSEESITLRPEGTAAVLRAYIQHSLGEHNSLVKMYYIGPMFRQERPQAGRLRQFHQFGAEVLGSSSPYLDVEMMLIPVTIYTTLGIESFSLYINSVGCSKCRPPYKELLKTELKKIYDQLSPDSQRRVEQNPLRVLDSKDESDRKLIANVPLLLNYLCNECSTHFEKVQSILNMLNIPYNIDGKLVRGLDYYTKTAFEITSTALGSQDALAGGGRYDGLVEELGGSSTPGVGFAAGIERLLMALEAIGNLRIESPSPQLYIVALDDEARQYAFKTAAELRSKGIAVELDYLERSIKAQMREANKLQSRFVLVVGSNELTSGKGLIKHMESGQEFSVDLNYIELPM